MQTVMHNLRRYGAYAQSAIRARRSPGDVDSRTIREHRARTRFGASLPENVRLAGYDRLQIIFRHAEAQGDNVDVKSSQATGNAAMHYVAWQLSKKGWNVMPTTRNAKGSDLYCANDAETIIFGVQSKGLAKRTPVALGPNLESLRSDWWIITINAKSNNPICFIMTRKEVIDLCFHSDPAKSRAGVQSHWLQPKAYDQPQFRDAWYRLSDTQT